MNKLTNQNQPTMKKIILITLLFCLAIPTFITAQNNMEDVVYLKNGNVLRGTIMEQIPNKSIVLKINDKNTMTIKFDEIEKITKEAVAEKQAEKKQPVEYKRKGFINLTELNYGYNISSVSNKNGGLNVKSLDPTFGFRTVNGYQFNPYITAGVGLGYEQYGNSGFLPITFDSRIMFSRKKVSPVLNINGGYSVGVNNSGGGCLNPAIGLRIFLSKKAAFLFNVGYKTQQIAVTYYDMYNNKHTTVDNIYFITVSAGVSF